jgi:hypothetical protein
MNDVLLFVFGTIVTLIVSTAVFLLVKVAAEEK